MFTGFEEQGLGARARELGAVALREKSTPLRLLADELLALMTVRTPHSLPSPPIDGRDELSALSTTVLDEHRERFREVFDSAAIGMGTMTLAGRLVRANSALAAIVGRPVASLVGTAFQDLLPGDAAEPFADALTAAITTDVGVVQFEHGLAGEKGDPRVRTALAPIRDAQGVALYLFAQLQDVSEQRAAEAALRQSEDRFRLLVDAVTDYAIFMLDPKGRVQSWNAGAQRMKGYTSTEIIGQHFRRFYPLEKQQARHPEHELETALQGRPLRRGGLAGPQGRQPVLGERRPVGDPRPQRRPHRLRQDHPRRDREAADAIEQASASAALAEANNELEVANARLARVAEDQAQFLAATVHELRTPIAILGGAADLLQDERQLKDSARRQLLDSMVANATTAAPAGRQPVDGRPPRCACCRPRPATGGPAADRGTIGARRRISVPDREAPSSNGATTISG